MKIYICENCSNFQKTKEAILKRHFLSDGNLIEYLPSGQPILTKEGRQAGYISISHTDNTLVMAIGNKPVGIDVERKSRKISSRICPSIEEWTKREAYGKFLGLGINKEVLSAVLPENLINTFFYGDYVIGVCSEERSESIQTLIDNVLFE